MIQIQAQNDGKTKEAQMICPLQVYEWKCKQTKIKRNFFFLFFSIRIKNNKNKKKSKTTPNK